MFSNVTQTYDLADATVEILFMLLVAFLLWYLLALLIYRKSSDESGEDIQEVVSSKKHVDNLQVIEWIGPKIQELLNKEGIVNFQDVSDVWATKLQSILHDAGPKFQMHNPKTWPDQAELASQERWSELKEYQELLNAGRG